MGYPDRDEVAELKIKHRNLVVRRLGYSEPQEGQMFRVRRPVDEDPVRLLRIGKSFGEKRPTSKSLVRRMQIINPLESKTD